jgi:hypothetical protein
MAVTHGGYLWLEQLVSIDVELIAYITSLPSWDEDIAQFLEEKTKEKELDKEMKKKYGTERGSYGITINHISYVAKRMDRKIMACKLLRKFWKKEFSTGVVAAVTQCVEGTTLDWAPYFFNLFLDDCKDMQDLGTTFHYSWLLILIALIGWKELKYSFFSTIPNTFH